jgi:branched-chain amino acid transport system ATP-binding protein
VLMLKNVEVVYHEVILVLRGVSIRVPDGKIVALLGGNGAGKTTVLRAISGILDVHNGEVTKGEILLDERRIHHLRAPKIVALGVSQVLEGRRILGELSVEENLKLGAHLARKDMADNLERVYGLFPQLRERPRFTAGYLSGGQQQMLAIGRALMSSPRFLLLDEPSLGLAPLLVQQMKEIIVEINRQGTGVLLVEQNAMMALSIADHG